MDHAEYSGSWCVVRYTNKAKRTTDLDRCVIFVGENAEEAREYMAHYPHKNVVCTPISDERASKGVTTFARTIMAKDLARETADFGVAANPAFPNTR